MIRNLIEMMFTPLHIQSNFHITLSSKPYLPTIRLEAELGKTFKGKRLKKKCKLQLKEKKSC
jgi:hypothetical protein